MKKLMISLSVLVGLGLAAALCAAESTSNAKQIITINDGLLSIDAQEVSVENIFKELGEVGGIKITAYENSFPAKSTNITFSDVPLEEALKKIIKITGVKNYITNYRKIGNQDRVSEIKFLSGGGKLRVLTSGSKGSTPRRAERPARPTVKTAVKRSLDHSEDELDDEIEALEEKFTWDDQKTAELAKEVLRDTPLQVRKGAMDSLMQTLNNSLKQQKESVVSREMIYKAFVEAVPAEIPEVRERVRKYLDAMAK